MAGEGQVEKDIHEPDAPGFDAHRKWKKLSAPMYDWMTNHHMTWPALACRYGPCTRLDAAKYEQTIYFSDQVGQDEKGVNKLVKQKVIIPEEGYSPMDHLNSWKENQRSPYFRKDRVTIHHPGDCNKIMEVQQVEDVVVTHGDCEEVFLWHFERQAQSNPGNNKLRKAGKSVPDVRLVGHTKNAPFALSTSSASPTIASGGEDFAVLVWNLHDYSGAPALGLPNPGNGAHTRGHSSAGDTQQQRNTLEGHTNTITSVCFRPGSDTTLLSTADDHVIKLWDVREQQATCTIIPATEDDIMCADWSACGNLVATGNGAGATHVYDVRKFTASTPQGERAVPLHEFLQYVRPPQAALSVAWSPRKPAWLATGGDDGRVCVFDTSRPDAPTADKLPSQLVLQHIGHLGNIMDCQWSPHDDYALMSVSNDSETYKDGGALQLWRLSFLLYGSVEDAMSLLRSHQKWLENGRLEDIPKNVPVATVPAVAAAQIPAVPEATAAPAAVAPVDTDAPMEIAAPVDVAAPVDTTAAAVAEPVALPAPAAEGAVAGGDVEMAGDEGAGGGPDESVATGVVMGGTDAGGDVDMQA